MDAYCYMQNVVWERLDNVMGNTQFLKADFQPYGVSSLAEQVSDAADLMQAAFAGTSPSKSSATQGAFVHAHSDTHRVFLEHAEP